jgi:hypothetical protein
MINSNKLKREAEKLKQEDKEFLLKFLKGGETLDKTNPSFRISQTIFNDFKDEMRKVSSLNDEQQYGQFKRLFNEIFYWSYSFQSDLDTFLDWFLEVFSDTNRNDFYKEFSKLYGKYNTNLSSFVDEICGLKDNEFESEDDEKEYNQAKRELLVELDTLLYMENDLRKIFNNLKKSLNKTTFKNESKNS